MLYMPTYNFKAVSGEYQSAIAAASNNAPPLAPKLEEIGDRVIHIFTGGLFLCRGEQNECMSVQQNKTNN